MLRSRSIPKASAVTPGTNLGAPGHPKPLWAVDVEVPDYTGPGLKFPQLCQHLAAGSFVPQCRRGHGELLLISAKHVSWGSLSHLWVETVLEVSGLVLLGGGEL